MDASENKYTDKLFSVKVNLHHIQHQYGCVCFFKSVCDVPFQCQNKLKCPLKNILTTTPCKQCAMT